MADAPSTTACAASTTVGGRDTDSRDSRNGGERSRNAKGRAGGRGRGPSRGGRGGGRGSGRGRGGFGAKDQGERKQKGDMGRGEYGRSNLDKRKRNDEEQAAKRRRIEEGLEEDDAPFSKEEIEAEARKPKRKVAVMIGYAGSGYKGMQINAQEKTIEGDIFKAFVAAGAISKANADDPKKSSLVRCARTDKGVHAAGNVISLKLIMEEPDIIQKINENLPPQIRVWGIERTNGAFSCYQTCDSRWYEYLIPTYSFLPPHPQSYLGKKLVESAEKEGVLETHQSLQEDVASFWKDAEAVYAEPILKKLNPATRDKVLAAVHASEEDDDVLTSRSAKKKAKTEAKKDDVAKAESEDEEADKAEIKEDGGAAEASAMEGVQDTTEVKVEEKEHLSPFEIAVKEVKAAYIKARKAYRISDFRRQRVQETLQCYLGTRNFHNYTIQKSYSDPSAKRVIKSFEVGTAPILINDTEWLSMKVHGQSFMMHQIRKMVAMMALVVRCGSSQSIINDSYGSANISIPKAPGLGLLLERPVFESYNKKAVSEFQRAEIDFKKYEKEMVEFKQREIYDRIFREEEKDHQFHSFFHHVDHFKTDYFLWVTASGIGAATQSKAPARTDHGSDDEEKHDPKGEEG